MAAFGAFEFDAVRRQVLRDGQEIHLTPKAFDLLKILIDAAPRVVTKAELHQRLWPGGFVAEATLVGLVKEIRRALDDRDRKAPLIRTAHRTGYAFAAVIKTLRPAAIARWLIIGERRIRLDNGEISIGRDPGCTVWLNFGSVSRRHARMLVSDASTSLEDLGSKNGTTIGTRPLKGARELCDGDQLVFGSVVAIYRCAAAGFPTVTHHGWSQSAPPAR